MARRVLPLTSYEGAASTRRSMRHTPISVVIPAHNEGALIGRCLGTLLSGARPKELDVVLVCNACTDDTEAAARAALARLGASGDDVRIVTTPIASKTNALNIGDALTRSFPRFYVDADVRLSIEAVREVARALRDGPALAASPQPTIDCAGRPMLVRAFYRVWTRLPYLRSGTIGSGIFALSRVGRARFGAFPELTGDDAFVRSLFAPHERVNVTSATFVVDAPRTIKDLIAIKARAHFGDLELARRYGAVSKAPDERHRRALVRLAADPRSWFDLAVYLTIRIVARARGRRRLERGTGGWARDESTRTAVSTRS